MKALNLHVLVKLLLYWYIFIFFSTEILSHLRLLERKYILFNEILFWVGFAFSHRREILLEIRNFNFYSKSTLFISTLFLLTFIQGFFSAPSTTDSMVYHIPRIMFWMQEKTLFQEVIRNAHDYMAPFGEYILLHLYLLFGSDRMLFFSQWIAFALSVYLSGVIAVQLGASQKMSMLVRLFTATLPIAAMQSANTQVDVVVAVLLLLSLHLALLLKQSYSTRNLILLGFAVGLGFLTKATFSFYVLIPFGLLFFPLHKNFRSFFLKIMPALILAFILQLRFISQNLSLYGNPLGVSMSDKGKDATYINEVISPLTILSNIIRNFFVHLPIPLFSSYVQDGIIQLHKFIGLEINDPRITCCGTQFSVKPIIYPQEDIVANPLHLIIIVLGGLFLVYRRKQLSSHLNVIVTYLLTICSFILFSTLIKWQPFHPRLEITFFMIGTMSSVLVLSFVKQFRLLYIGAVLSGALALTVILLNVSRPYIPYSLFYGAVQSFKPSLADIPEAFYLKPREQQYFNARNYWYEPYLQAVNLLKQTNRDKVTFYLEDGFEYPLWVLMRRYGANQRVIPYSQADEDTIIISSGEVPYYKDNYKTICYKTTVNYGYACFSTKNSL